MFKNRFWKMFVVKSHFNVCKIAIVDILFLSISCFLIVIVTDYCVVVLPLFHVVHVFFCFTQSQVASP